MKKKAFFYIMQLSNGQKTGSKHLKNIITTSFESFSIKSKIPFFSLFGGKKLLIIMLFT
jgi:hypothetical protein